MGDVTTGTDTVTLWRPTGPEELALVEASGWRKWPPRLAGQPIFYPVLNEEYATKIARDWNVRQSGAGYVTRFQVRRSFLDQYEVHQVGGQTILEYWIPAEDLGALNARHRRHDQGDRGVPLTAIASRHVSVQVRVADNDSRSVPITGVSRRSVVRLARLL